MFIFSKMSAKMLIFKEILFINFLFCKIYVSPEIYAVKSKLQMKIAIFTKWKVVIHIYVNTVGTYTRNLHQNKYNN